MVSNVTFAKIFLIQRLRRKLQRKERSCYVRPLFLNRSQDPQNNLVLELRDDPHYHFRYFRMNKAHFDEILDLVRPLISHHRNHIRPISPLERLAVTIRYLASGNSQISLALHYRMSPSSVSGIIKETLSALSEKLQKYLPEMTTEKWIQNEDVYNRKWNFPNACGSIDGKHVRVKALPASGSLYYNYKDYFSIVLLAIANADFKFNSVDIGSYGSQSDGGILSKSPIGKRLDKGTLGLPTPKPIIPAGMELPHIILGDDAFPLRHYILKPFKGNFLKKEDRIFNYRLSRARMTVENAFGLLAARFRIFHCSIEANVEVSKNIVMSSVLLHNFLLSKRDFNNITADIINNVGDIREGNWRDTTRNDTGLTDISRQGSNNYSAYAAKVRDDFKAYFLSVEGQVSWQDAHVNAGL